MARPRTITDQQLLCAARDVFLDKGYSATTAEIARHAGVSEGTLFRRFPSKEQLFIGALGLDEQPAWFALVDELVGQGDLRDNLRRIAHAMHTHFCEHIPKLMGLMTSPLESLELLRAQREPMPVRGIRKLAEFFERERALGRVSAEVQPLIVARLLAGALHFLVFSERGGFAWHFGEEREQVIGGILDHIARLVRPEQP